MNALSFTVRPYLSLCTKFFTIEKPPTKPYGLFGNYELEMIHRNFRIYRCMPKIVFETWSTTEVKKYLHNLLLLKEHEEAKEKSVK